MAQCAREGSILLHKLRPWKPGLYCSWWLHNLQTVVQHFSPGDQNFKWLGEVVAYRYATFHNTSLPEQVWKEIAQSDTTTRTFVL